MDLSAVMNDDEATPPHEENAESAVVDDTETYRRKYEELKKVYVAAEQDREELSARYAALTARLDRISTENEYLLSELSYYERSDLESDQSDIEFVTARPGATPRSTRANSRAKRSTDATARKPKPKPKQAAPAATVKVEEAASNSTGATTKRKRPAPSGSKPKKAPAKKKPAKTDE